MNLDQFIASNLRNEWINEPGLHYYVRKNLLYPGAIDLANVEPSRDGSVGGFWRFLRRYSTRIPFRVENVLNPDLAAYLRRLGWRETFDLAEVPTFYSPLFDQTFPDVVARQIAQQNRLRAAQDDLTKGMY